MINDQLAKAMRTVQSKLLFVLASLVVYRFGTHIPIPGLDPVKLKQLFSGHSNTILGMFNMFSGGALSRLSIFAVGIMPYISASIIVQLMSTVVPALEQLKKEGEAGRRKLTQYTRYLTLLIAMAQAFGMTKWLMGNGTAYHIGANFVFVSIVSLVTGSLLLMWIGEQITEKGLGNGVSLIIFAGIVSKLPTAFAELSQQISEGVIHPISVIFIAALILLVVAFVVFIEKGQRRIAIQYPQRTQGRHVYGAQRSHLPLKINMAGVIPPIFASSIILLPATVVGFVSQSWHLHWLETLVAYLRPETLTFSLLNSLAIMFFSFFYTALVFNPKETSDNLKKSGAMIPGIRPGDQTADYIDKIMTKLTLVGALYLVLVCLLPQVFMNLWHVSLYLGGTSLLIVVVVVMDFMANLQSQLISHQYDSLFKKGGLQSLTQRGRDIL